MEAVKDETICEGNSVVLNAADGFSYNWSPATGLSSNTTRNPIAKPADTTSYTLTVTDKNGCTLKDSLTIYVLKKPVANAGPEVKIFDGQSAKLTGTIKGTNVQFYWTPDNFMDNANLVSPTVSPPDNITYSLHVVSNVGCGMAEDDVFVRVFKKVIVPNAFSPNGDGINDVWSIEALETYSESVIAVFNRYGQEVFQSRGYSKTWDGKYNGKPLPAGTYYYVIDLKNGSPALNGWVLIVR